MIVNLNFSSRWLYNNIDITHITCKRTHRIKQTKVPYKNLNQRRFRFEKRIYPFKSRNSFVHLILSFLPTSMILHYRQQRSFHRAFSRKKKNQPFWGTILHDPPRGWDKHSSGKTCWKMLDEDSIFLRPRTTSSTERGSTYIALYYF